MSDSHDPEDGTDAVRPPGDEFRRKLRAFLIDETGMSQTQVGDALGVSQGAVGSYLSNAKSNANPSWSVMKEMARVFDVPLDYLADDDAREAPTAQLARNWSIIRSLIRQHGTAEVIRLIDIGRAAERGKGSLPGRKRTPEAAAGIPLLFHQEPQPKTTEAAPVNGRRGPGRPRKSS